MAYFLVPKDSRKHVGTALLLTCSIYVGSFFVQVFKGQARPSGVLATVAEERAEMTLRMMTTVNVGVSKFVESTGMSLFDEKDPKAKNKSLIEVSSENLGPFFRDAKKALDEAIKQNPRSAELKAKRAVLAAISAGKHKPTKEIKKLCNELLDSPELDSRKLGLVLKRVLLDEKPLPPSMTVPAALSEESKEIDDKAVSKDNSAQKDLDIDTEESNEATKKTSQSDSLEKKEPQDAETTDKEAKQKSRGSGPLSSGSSFITAKDGIAIIEKGIAKGWYRENAKLLYYTASNDSVALGKLRKQLEERYWDKFRFMIVAYSIGGLCAFIGLVTIVIHFGSLGRKDPKEIPPEERVGIDLDVRTIYSVFVGWLSVELMMSHFLRMLPKNMMNLGGDPVGIAAFSLVSYIITMIPAFLLIYFIAFKPRGYKFYDALKLRFKTSTAGPFKLILAGFLTWCSVIPMVLMSALIASNLLGSQGSDNPVLSQISMVANSNNILAIALLYFTVAAAAPFFEEVIFRGFLYSSVKSKFGIFPAILVSAFVFAFIHFDKGGALMLFALGPVLAISYDRSRSLIPAMIAHGLWNGGSFAMAVSLYFSS